MWLLIKQPSVLFILASASFYLITICSQILILRYCVDPWIIPLLAAPKYFLQFTIRFPHTSFHIHYFYRDLIYLLCLLQYWKIYRKQLLNQSTIPPLFFTPGWVWHHTVYKHKHTIYLFLSMLHYYLHYIHLMAPIYVFKYL